MNTSSEKQNQNSPAGKAYTNDKFWDLIFQTKSGGLFSFCEKTYLKRVPGGWLMRQFFFKGREFTRSAILFFPDSKGLWNDGDFDILWEEINIVSNPNFKLILERLETPEGWIVKEFLTTKPSYSREGVTGLTLTYIPDMEHTWEISPRVTSAKDESSTAGA